MNASTVIYCFLGAVIILCVLFGLILLNRASDQSLSLIFRVYAALVLAGGLLLLSIFSPLPEYSTDIHILFVHDKNLRLAPLMGPLVLTGSAHTQGYLDMEFISIEWREKQKKRNAKHGAISDEEAPEFYLDLFEKTFWYWLSRKYAIHWMVKRYWFHGISGGGGSVGQAPNAEKLVYTLRKQDIFKLLSGNRLVLDEAMLGDVKFPAGSEVTVKRETYRRTIEICNRHLQLKIELTSAGGGVIEATTLAEKIKDKWPLSSSQWWEEHVNVSFHCQYNKLLRWSPSTKNQKEWLNEMTNMFRNDFEWSLIRNDLEKAFDTIE